MFTDNPLADYYQHEIEQEKMLERLPRCTVCDEPIQQEKAVYYFSQWFCKECEQNAWKEIRKEYLECVE